MKAGERRLRCDAELVFSESTWDARRSVKSEDWRLLGQRPVYSLRIPLAFFGQEVQTGNRGETLCGCRGRVPNPGQALGLAGRKRTCWLPDEMKAPMKYEAFLFRAI
jgi:hypothetical protein